MRSFHKLSYIIRKAPQNFPFYLFFFHLIYLPVFRYIWVTLSTFLRHSLACSRHFFAFCVYRILTLYFILFYCSNVFIFSYLLLVFLVFFYREKVDRMNIDDFSIKIEGKMNLHIQVRILHTKF